MATIKERARKYSATNAINNPPFAPKEFVEVPYAKGADEVLREVQMTISVLEDGYLESNLRKLIKELKGE
ncbi:MAG: hypothetical protein IJV24_07280 [Prevotella sp.]|nr:hypothetical protein [Prevotella sp.]